MKETILTQVDVYFQTITFGGSDTMMRNLFPSYLTRLNSSNSRHMKTEVSVLYEEYDLINRIF